MRNIKRSRTMGLTVEALEEFLWLGQQRQRGRAGVVGRKRRRMTRSNLKYARRSASLIERIARRMPRHKSVAIPVHLRPGVPHVDAALGYPEKREAILAEAKRLLPGQQFKVVYERWLEGTAAAEQTAARLAKHKELVTWMQGLTDRQRYGV